jgi:hypothetical protein
MEKQLTPKAPRKIEQPRDKKGRFMKKPKENLSKDTAEFMGVAGPDEEVLTKEKVETKDNIKKEVYAGKMDVFGGQKEAFTRVIGDEHNAGGGGVKPSIESEGSPHKERTKVESIHVKSRGDWVEVHPKEHDRLIERDKDLLDYPDPKVKEPQKGFFGWLGRWFDRK